VPLIGDGLIARAFHEMAQVDDSATIFAAGVSNSRETDPAAFAREANRLDAALAEASGVFVYFGTCSMFDPLAKPTPYVAHKLNMEAKIRDSGKAWRVFRLPQVVGPAGSPNTLVNFFVHHLRAGAPFDVWANATRALIAVADVVRISRYLLASGGSDRAINFWTTSVTPRDIVRDLEAILGITGNYQLTQRGEPYAVEAIEFQAACAAIGLEIGPAYTERVLRDAYGR